MEKKTEVEVLIGTALAGQKRFIAKELKAAMEAFSGAGGKLNAGFAHAANAMVRTFLTASDEGKRFEFEAGVRQFAVTALSGFAIIDAENAPNSTASALLAVEITRVNNARKRNKLEPLTVDDRQVTARTLFLSDNFKRIKTAARNTAAVMFNRRIATACRSANAKYRKAVSQSPEALKKSAQRGAQAPVAKVAKVAKVATAKVVKITGTDAYQRRESVGKSLSAIREAFHAFPKDSHFKDVDAALAACMVTISKI